MVVDLLHETGEKLPHATLLGHGLMELLENHLSALPSLNGSPFTLVVTIGIDALMSGLGVADTDTGHRISAGEARRLACKAGIVPMVLDGDSMPLDLGRERRLFDRYQKHAINQRYHGCAADNCDRPPAWVEYHHQDPWSRGGATDAKNGISLCPAHHRMADHPDSYDMRRLPDGQGPVQPAHVDRHGGLRSGSARRLVGHGSRRHAPEPAVEADVLGARVQRPPQRRVRRPRQRLVAVAPGGAEADPHRRPVGGEVPLATVPHQQPVPDLEGLPRPVLADRRGPHRPHPQVQRHQLELEVGEDARVAPARSRRSRAVLVSPATR